MSNFEINKKYSPISDVVESKIYTTLVGTTDYINKFDIASNPSANGNVSFNNISQNNTDTILSKKAFLHYTYKVTFNGTTSSGTTLIQQGYDAPSFMPIHSSIESAKVKMNGTQYNYQISENFRYRSRYFDYDKVFKNITSSYCYPDMYANYADAFQTNDDPLSTINDNKSYTNYPPRGCIHNLRIEKNTNTECILYFEAIEPIMFPPFLCGEQEEGLYNIKSLDITLNHTNPEIIWSHNPTNTTITSMNVEIIEARFEYSQAAIPNGLSTPLNCIVPTYNYDLKTTQGSQVAAGTSSTISSNNIILNSIPDYILVWVAEDMLNASLNEKLSKPAAICAPISNIRVQFGTSKPLMQDLTQHQLYNQMLLSGLDMNYDQFCGESSAINGANVSKKILCGAPIKLIPALSAFNQELKLVSGLKTTDNLQIQVTFKNNNSSAKTLNLYTLLVYNGVMNITKEGRAIENFVFYDNVQEVLSAPVSSLSVEEIYYTPFGGSFFEKLKNFGKKAFNFVKDKKLISNGLNMASQMLPEKYGTIANIGSQVADNFGFGKCGSGVMAGSLISPEDLYN